MKYCYYIINLGWNFPANAEQKNPHIWSFWNILRLKVCYSQHEYSPSNCIWWGPNNTLTPIILFSIFFRSNWFHSILNIQMMAFSSSSNQAFSIPFASSRHLRWDVAMGELHNLSLTSEVQHTELQWGLAEPHPCSKYSPLIKKCLWAKLHPCT